MKIFFTLILFLFFSLSNANARLDKSFMKEIMTKGRVIAYFFDEGKKSDTKTIIMKYRDEVYECKIFGVYSCEQLKAF